jgi:hypothetical protein
MSGTHPFDADTAVVPGPDGRAFAVVTDRWNALGGMPNGGYQLAIATAALARALPAPDPLVVAGTFLRRAAPGPTEVAVQVRHTGRRMSSGTATMSQDGRDVLHVAGTFTDLDRLDGPTLHADDPPDLPPPDRCVEMPDGTALGATITSRLDYRLPTLPGWLTGTPSGRARAEFWIRLRGREPDLASLPLVVDAAAPVVLDLGATWSTTLQLTVHLRAQPAPGWLKCRVVTRHLLRGTHEEDFDVWDSQDTLVAQSRQLAISG